MCISYWLSVPQLCGTTRCHSWLHVRCESDIAQLPPCPIGCFENWFEKHQSFYIVWDLFTAHPLEKGTQIKASQCLSSHAQLSKQLQHIFFLHWNLASHFFDCHITLLCGFRTGQKMQRLIKLTFSVKIQSGYHLARRLWVFTLLGHCT